MEDVRAGGAAAAASNNPAFFKGDLSGADDVEVAHEKDVREGGAAAAASGNDDKAKEVEAPPVSDLSLRAKAEDMSLEWAYSSSFDSAEVAGDEGSKLAASMDCLKGDLQLEFDRAANAVEDCDLVADLDQEAPQERHDERFVNGAEVEHPTTLASVEEGSVYGAEVEHPTTLAQVLAAEAASEDADTSKVWLSLRV